MGRSRRQLGLRSRTAKGVFANSGGSIALTTKDITRSDITENWPLRYKHAERKAALTQAASMGERPKKKEEKEEKEEERAIIAVVIGCRFDAATQSGSGSPALGQCRTLVSQQWMGIEELQHGTTLHSIRLVPPTIYFSSICQYDEKGGSKQNHDSHRIEESVMYVMSNYGW